MISSISISDLGFALLMGCLIFAFTRCDRLIRIEHDRYPDQWVMDGTPSGFFWRPPEPRSIWQHWKAYTTRDRLILRLMFTTPDWAEDDPEARKSLQSYRIAMFVFYAGIIPLFCVSLGLPGN